MTNPSGYIREGTVKITHGAGYKTWRENSTGKIIDWEFDVADNYYKLLTVLISNGDNDGAINLLSSSCAVWSSGTGALTLGDKVEFGLYQSDGLTIEWVYEGIVVNIEPAGNDTIKIQAYDYSRALDFIKPNKVYYKNVRNCVSKSGSYVNGYLKLTGVDDADIQTPFIRMAVNISNPTLTTGDGVPKAGYNIAAAAGRKVAQPFIAEGNFFTGGTIYFTTSNYDDGLGNTYTFTVRLKNTDPNNINLPGATIEEWTITPSLLSSAESQSLIMFAMDSNPKIVPGAKYWLEFQADTIAGSLIIDAEGPNTAETPEGYKYYNGANWAGSGDQIHLYNLMFSLYDDYDPADYYFDDTNDEVWATKYVNNLSPTPGGLLSYFYGTRTLEEVVEWLCRLDTGLLADANTNCDLTMKTFSTKGMTIAEALRVLAGTFETSGTFSGRQHAFGFYRDGSSIPRLKFNAMLDITNDSEAYIFSYPSDRPSNPDEWLIIGDGPDLKKTYKQKYCEVTVIGERFDGMPLIRTVSDRAKSGSMYVLTGGVCERITVTDKSLMSLDDVNREAFRRMDAVSRDVWEGSILLSGHHLGIHTFDNTSDYFSSSKICKIYWSPLGIAGVKMKVTRVIFRMNGTTEIFVNNIDPRLLNKVTKGLGTTEKNDAFLAPVGDPETVYIETYYDTAITNNNQMTIKLYDESNVAVSDSHPVNATRYTSSRYNSRSYHAEFEMENGRASSKVRYIELLDGVTQIAKIDLNRTTSSIEYDEMAEKWLTNRLVVELNCKDS